MSDEEVRDLERRAHLGDPAARGDLARHRARLGLPTRAVIGCVHGNLEAFEAVLADIERESIFEVYCVGDLVGYGPDPLECVALARDRCAVVVKGQFDAAVFEKDLSAWTAVAARWVVEWTRERLAGRDDLLSWLENLPSRHEDGGDLFVHGSPRDPLSEFVFAETFVRGGAAEAAALFAEVPARAFNAHTHIPCVLSSTLAVTTPAGATPWTRRRGEKALVNVGSVGQSRDRDTRACWVAVAGDSIEWRRVGYDVEKTARKIEAAGFPSNIAQRLRLGL